MLEYGLSVAYKMESKLILYNVAHVQQGEGW